MTVLEFLHETFNANAPFGFICRPYARCADGYQISIQGGTSSHMCRPRMLCDEYERVELGYPNQSDDLLTEHMYWNDRSQMVNIFPYVPIEIVEQLVAKHGGIINFK